MTKLYELKQEQKELAKVIRKWKNRRKQDKRGSYTIDQVDYYVAFFARKYRKQHIAYCMARGKTYEEIERSTRKPIDYYAWLDIKRHIEELREEKQEAA
jgi:hypothetical protein